MQLFLALLLALVVNEGPGTNSLFSGEFVVREDGIYTYAHYYQHPITKKRVVIVGINHGGDKEYFEQVLKILNEAEVVL